MNNKELNMLSIIAVVISIICLSVAFASLNTTLKITGTSFFHSSTWNIGFLTPTNLNSSITGKWTDNPIGGEIEGEPKVIGNTVYFSAELENKGDYVEFDLPVKNSGTINAILGSLATSVTGIDKDLLIFTVKDELNSPVVNGGITLDKNETKTITIRVEFDPLAVSLPSVDTDITIEVSMIWQQN